jgi:KUP system potassium uptake protein
VNVLLALGTILTVAFFGSTANLSAAYGIAVTGTMAITTTAYFLVLRRVWQHPLWWTVPWCVLFLLIDVAFLSSNAHKITEGGWFPLVLGGFVLALMHTWKLGRAEIYRRVYGQSIPKRSSPASRAVVTSRE